MIHRKPGPIKRFLATLLRRTLWTLLAVLLYALGSFLFLRLTKDLRAVEIVAPAPPLEAPAQPPDSLRLCTWNIAHGRGGALGALNTDGGTAEEKRARLEQIGRRLGELRLDLVLLNEVDFNTWWSHGMDQAEIIAQAGGFPYIVKQANIDSGIPGVRRYFFGNVLLSRFPIEDAEKVRFPPYSELEKWVAGNHDALLARVRLGGDRTLTVLGVHLEVRSEDTRVAAAGEIIRLQRELQGSLIVLGDFNSTPPGFPDSRVSASGQNAIELLDSFGKFHRRPLRGRASAETFTFPSQAPRRIIDWILPDHHWTFMQYEVLQGQTESDHLPVCAAVRWR